MEGDDGCIGAYGLGGLGSQHLQHAMGCQDRVAAEEKTIFVI